MSMLTANDAREIAKNAEVSDLEHLFRMIRAAAMVGLYSVELRGVFNEDIFDALVKSDFNWTIEKTGTNCNDGFTYTISWGYNYN